MADSASSYLKLRLMEDSVTTSWGDKVDTNMQMLDLAIAGSVTHASDANLDLTAADADYTADNAKAALINVTAALSAQRTITIPNRKKFYVVRNADATYSVVVGTSGGTTRTVTAGSIAYLWCDGAGVTYFVGPLTNATTGAPNTSSGAAASAVSFTPAGSISATNVQAAIAELDGDVTANTAALATKQDADADLTTLAGLSKADGNFIVGNGTDFTVESGATARASLGLATLEDLLSAPGADRFALYDHSALKFVHGTFGNGFTVSGTTVTAGVVQMADAVLDTVNSTASNIPVDATIPQNTEGAEILTKAITPKSATNKLRIEASVFVGHDTEGVSAVLALFQDSTANALTATVAPVYNTVTSSGNTPVATLTLRHIMDAGTTSSTTFKLRVGASSGTLFYNATSLLSGVAPFSTASPLAYISITEYTP